jgi:hypothetical protein
LFRWGLRIDGEKRKAGLAAAREKQP